MAHNQRVIPYGRQQILDEDVEAVVDCLRGDFLTQGPRIAQFEAALCRATQAPHARVVSNGTAALHLACMALGLGRDDVAITSAVTFVASANCIEYCGARAVFADVDAQTGLVDVAEVARIVDQLGKEGQSPKLLIPVDLTGQPAELARLSSIATSVGAAVISDAAHSLGGAYDAEGETIPVGRCLHSDAAILSFHPVKHITSGEGGAVVCRDAAVAERLGALRAHGIHKQPERMTLSQDSPFSGPWYYEQDQLGFNYRMTDIQAALGISQLGRLDSFVNQRRALAARYDEAVSQAPLDSHLRPVRQRSGARSAYHLYVVQVIGSDDTDVLANKRKSLYSCLRERNIFTQIHYIPVPWQPYYQRKYGLQRDQFPGALDYYARSLSIPLFPTLEEQDFERVVAALSDWARTQ